MTTPVVRRSTPSCRTPLRYQNRRNHSEHSKKMTKKRKLKCLKNNSEQSSYFKLSSRFDFCLIFAGFFCEPPAWFPRLHNPITKCLRIWMASAPLRDWYGRNHRENQDISGGKQHDRINSQPQFKVLIPKFSLKPLDRQHFNKLGYDRHQSGWRHSKQGRVMRKSSARGGGWAAILTEFNIFPFFSSFSSFFLFSLFPSPPHTQFFYTFSSSHFPFFIIFSLPLLSFFSTLAFFTSFFPRARVCVCVWVCVWVCVSLSPPPLAFLELVLFLEWLFCLHRIAPFWRVFGAILNSTGSFYDAILSRFSLSASACVFVFVFPLLGLNNHRSGF